MTEQQRKAMELALEALEIASDHYHTYHDGYKGSKTTQAITAIKEALAQPEQEPVAWMHPSGGVVQRLITGFDRELYTIPLYTTPPQRKPLTEEQAFYLFGVFYNMSVIRSVEAAHGIKGPA